MKEFSPEYEVMSWEMMIVTYTYRRYLLPDPCFVTGVIRPFISSGYICHNITQHLSVRLSLYPSHMWPMWSPLANLAGPLLKLYVWLCPMVNCSSLHLSLPFILLLFSNILAMGPLHQNRSVWNTPISNSMYMSMVFIDDSQ